MPLIDPDRIVPKFDFVLVQLGGERQSAGGIVLPPNANTDKMIGTVMAVGPGLRYWQAGVPKLNSSGELLPQGYDCPVDVEVGDRVIVSIARDSRGNPMDPDVTDFGDDLVMIRSTMIVAGLQP